MVHSLTYMPRLDGLRALAVAGVLLEHFAPSKLPQELSAGGAGVTLFFVLSGYLITRVLLGYRGENLGRAAANFYWRRFLRLSPPFYLAILIGVLANVMQMRETWWIHASYLTNVQIALTGHWTGGADHFWSLCTEEQFYLLWFFVVVTLPGRYLTAAIGAALIITLLFQFLVWSLAFPPVTTVLLPGNLGSLAIGALLAHARNAQGGHNPDHPTKLQWISDLTLSRRALIPTAVGFVTISASLPFTTAPAAILYPFIISVFSLCLVSVSSSDSKDPWFDWLAWRPLRHVGKISYGIYIYHQFIPPLMTKFSRTEWAVANPTLWFLFLTFTTVIVAHLSWVLLESPILRLKRYVPMKLREA